MATLDIRDIIDDEITEIKFSNNELVSNENEYIEFSQNIPNRSLYIHKSDIPNLIAALNKAKELGWY